MTSVPTYGCVLQLHHCPAHHPSPAPSNWLEVVGGNMSRRDWHCSSEVSMTSPVMCWPGDIIVDHVSTHGTFRR